jgi:hypothetical protein
MNYGFRSSSLAVSPQRARQIAEKRHPERGRPNSGQRESYGPLASTGTMREAAEAIAEFSSAGTTILLRIVAPSGRSNAWGIIAAL